MFLVFLFKISLNEINDPYVEPLLKVLKKINLEKSDLEDREIELYLFFCLLHLPIQGPDHLSLKSTF